MGKYDHLFVSMQNAKPISMYAERLPNGNYVLALKRFGIKPSDKELGNIVEAEFVVVQTDNPTIKVDEVRGWAWFPNSPGWAGKYDEARCTEFIKNVIETTGDDRQVAEVGSDLYDDGQPYKGLLVAVSITRGKPNNNIPGEYYQNAKWLPVEGQDQDMVAAQRQQIEALEKVQAAAAPAPAQQPAAAQPARGGFNPNKFLKQGQQPDQGQPAQQATQQPVQTTTRSIIGAGFRKG